MGVMSASREQRNRFSVLINGKPTLHRNPQFVPVVASGSGNPELLGMAVHLAKRVVLTTGGLAAVPITERILTDWPLVWGRPQPR